MKGIGFVNILLLCCCIFDDVIFGSPVTLNENIAECSIVCSGIKKRPLCGSDGQTYDNKCEIRRLRQCQDSKIRVAYRGECKDGETEKNEKKKKEKRPRNKKNRTEEERNCNEEREKALRRMERRPMAKSYVPECTLDGGFHEVQCHDGTGYCWCVSPDGKPLSGTSKVIQDKLIPTQLKCQIIKECESVDRFEFNSNLMELFSLEFDRMPVSQQPQLDKKPQVDSNPESLLTLHKKRVMEWKFNSLDSDKDGSLTRREIRSLKRLVKKHVKPKSCAKTFDTYCDLNDDGSVVIEEWFQCLEIRYVETEETKSPTGNVIKSKDKNPSSPTGIDISLLLRRSSTDQNHQNVHNVKTEMTPKTHAIKTDGLEESDAIEDDYIAGARDCLEEKQFSKDLFDVDPEGDFFTPDCLPDGTYRPQQCHGTTGYCWCVEPKTGTPIPGTSTHNELPDCTQAGNRFLKGIHQRHPDEGSVFLTFPVPT